MPSRGKSKPAQSSFADFLSRWYVPLLVVILLFSFVSRVHRLWYPTTYVFDEVYHAVTAKLIAVGDPRAFEWWHQAPEPNTAIDWLHPPLAKYTQAFFISIFGANSFGWRLSAALFGVGVIWLTTTMAKDLFGKPVGLLAGLLASMDGLLLTQSRIAMNDIHVTFFILATLVMYWRYRQRRSEPIWLVLTGLLAGIALSSKWSGAFVIGSIALWEMMTYAPRLLKPTSVDFKRIALTFVSMVILPLFIYVSAYLPMFMQGKTLVCFKNQAITGACYYETFQLSLGSVKVIDWQGYTSHFGELHRQIWWYQTHLTATHDYQSRPGQWFLNLRPVWFFVEYNIGPSEKIANIYAMGNPFLFWFGAVAVVWSTVWIAVKLVLHRHKLQSPTLTKLAFVLFNFLIVWLPWQFSPRIMFFYHYTPAVPLLAILLGYWLWQLFTINLKKKNPYRFVFQSVAAGVVVLIVLSFGMWYPYWTGLPLTPDQLTLLRWLPSWK